MDAPHWISTTRQGRFQTAAQPQAESVLVWTQFFFFFLRSTSAFLRCFAHACSAAAAGAPRGEGSTGRSAELLNDRIHHREDPSKNTAPAAPRCAVRLEMGPAQQGRIPGGGEQAPGPSLFKFCVLCFGPVKVRDNV